MKEDQAQQAIAFITVCLNFSWLQKLGDPIRKPIMIRQSMIHQPKMKVIYGDEGKWMKRWNEDLKDERQDMFEIINYIDQINLKINAIKLLVH